ncbi:mitochondrial fission regulator 1-like [Acanthaster planci]|uniref:Mitochondrial fission regulator 1-like n=1 Tax=Acanthaster planci TaxID=133434 RepID=A0A8B7YDE5_ACAPL|nr:mitochondrial fission regulator 1-like [Acanthaster planci]XP_022089676.1 mitochondrial fission regulator 1-like [Acanthaster planci]XP_022089677.1 mitochondrial fission regulator 1-like [Acanthaster planci]
MSAQPVDLVLYIRMVLNYLGLESNYREHVNARAKKGRHRSLVRQIGTSLPLKPVRRVHFQIVSRRHYARRQNRTPQFIDDECEPMYIANLADLSWIDISSPDKNVRGRAELRPFVSRRKSLRTPRRRTCFIRRPREPDISELSDEPYASPSVESFSRSLCALDASTPVYDPSALAKIGQLEDELSKLRAQIAHIVTLQSQQQPTGATPAPVPPPPPASGGPPPPPPPPPPPVAASTQCLSVAGQIRLNRAKKGKEDSSSSISDGGKPNMADVLKGLGSVKLRTVARSPGGTPIRQKPRPTTANDAAALIAQALKRKFARQRAEESPDNKENNVWVTPSPKKNSPRNASPKFGQHLLKPTKLSQGTRSSRPLVEINV